MNTKEFLQLLEEQPNHDLVFEYEKDKFVPASYHITEVKNVHIESVDCGGRPDSYDQTIVQLWVNPKEQVDRIMTAQKALKIFHIVNSKTPMKQETPLFFEWGLGELRTSTYQIETVENIDNQLTIKLYAPPTVCKPNLELEMSDNNCGGGGCC